jgi:hypothetical protein
MLGANATNGDTLKVFIPEAQGGVDAATAFTTVDGFEGKFVAIIQSYGFNIRGVVAALMVYVSDGSPDKYLIEVFFEAAHTIERFFFAGRVFVRGAHYSFPCFT